MPYDVLYSLDMYILMMSLDTYVVLLPITIVYDIILELYYTRGYKYFIFAANYSPKNY